uniref:Platelet-derived growth factor (PDGF) family profile domain-containing protein n=1 Tax=Pseudonaja textilis TaxID=8673 RepID=A0A670ZG64_PSETE
MGLGLLRADPQPLELSQGQGAPDPLSPFPRGTCQPREVLVNVHKEPPQGSGHFFKPSCVALQRCAGCCSDEAVQCSAGQKRTVSLQIMLVSSSTQTSQLEKEDFTEHVTCECSCLRTASPRRLFELNSSPPPPAPLQEEPRKRAAESQASLCLSSL